MIFVVWDRPVPSTDVTELGSPPRSSGLLVMALEASRHTPRRIISLVISRGCIFAIALLHVFSPSAYGQDLQTPEAPATVHGTVINSITRAPIARALVFTQDNRFAVLTDGNGHFEFPIPLVNNEADISYASFGPLGSVPGPFGLMARKPGFLDFRQSHAEVESSSDSEITLSLTPEALIKGRVTLSTSDAPLGLSVQLFSRHVQNGLPRWIPGGSVQTNSAGEFRFADLPPGAYKVVTHEYLDNDPSAILPGQPPFGFPPVYYPNSTDFTSAETIQLTAGETFEANLSLSAQPYYQVKIPVTGSETPALDITVFLQGRNSPGYSLGFNAEKHQIEGLLPSGNFQVEARQVEARTFGPGGVFGTVNLRVAGEPADGPTLTLTPCSRISLNVTEEFNDTARNASPSVNWRDGKHNFTLHGPRANLNAFVESIDDSWQQNSSLRPPSSSKDQSLVLENLAPGRYWLRLTPSRGYVASATLGATDLLREPLVIGSGSNASIEIKMRDDGAEIEGKITGVTGVPEASSQAASSRVHTPQAWVYCVPLPDSHGEVHQAPVSSDGAFSFSMLAPGSYRVLAFSGQQPELPYRDPEAMRPYETKGQVIQVTAGQKAKMQLQLISSTE